MSAFAKAKSTVTASPKKSSKPQTVWPLGDPQHAKLGKAITQLHEISEKRKALSTQEDMLKGLLKPYAEDRFLEAFANTGVSPDSPMMLANEAGQSVTFVVQDRTGNYDVKDDMAEAITQVLGPDGAAELLFETTIFGFSTTVLDQEVKDGSGRKVIDVLGDRLTGLLEEMRDEGLLSQEQVDATLTAKNIRTFRPGTVVRLASICGRNTTKMRSFLAAAGSAIVRYIKC